MSHFVVVMMIHVHARHQAYPKIGGRAEDVEKRNSGWLHSSFIRRKSKAPPIAILFNSLEACAGFRSLATPLSSTIVRVEFYRKFGVQK